jgi:hypothetical protein
MIEIMSLAIEREPVPLVTTTDGVVIVAGTRVSYLWLTS